MCSLRIVGDIESAFALLDFGFGGNAGFAEECGEFAVEQVFEVVFWHQACPPGVTVSPIAIAASAWR